MVFVVKRKDGRYLTGVIPMGWSVARHDAVRMRSEIGANVIAGLVGGRVVKLWKVKRCG